MMSVQKILSSTQNTFIVHEMLCFVIAFFEEISPFTLYFFEHFQSVINKEFYKINFNKFIAFIIISKIKSRIQSAKFYFILINI